MSVYEDLNTLQSKDLQVIISRLVECIHELHTFFGLVVKVWNIQVLQLHRLQRFRLVEKLGLDVAFRYPNLCQD